MGIIKDALNRQIQDDNRQMSFGTSATILNYYKESNTADIEFTDPNSGDAMFRASVPLAITMGGITGGCISAGQRCSISFVNNNIYSPIITGITDSLYSRKTCGDQGAYIVDSRILSCSKPEKIVPMSSDWIDYDNKDKSKYINDLSCFSELSAVHEVYELTSTIDKYKNTEQGITNLETGSTCKIKENGDIDIFVANNLGIRISPSSRSIDVYGTFKINGREVKIEDLHS